MGGGRVCNSAQTRKNGLEALLGPASASLQRQRSSWDGFAAVTYGQRTAPGTQSPDDKHSLKAENGMWVPSAGCLAARHHLGERASPLFKIYSWVLCYISAGWTRASSWNALCLFPLLCKWAPQQPPALVGKSVSDYLSHNKRLMQALTPGGAHSSYQLLFALYTNLPQKHSPKLRMGWVCLAWCHPQPPSGKKLALIKCLSNFLINLNEIKTLLGSQLPTHSAACQSGSSDGENNLFSRIWSNRDYLIILISYKIRLWEAIFELTCLSLFSV